VREPILRTLVFRRAIDTIAVLLLLFVIYRIFIAPRVVPEASSYSAPRVTYATLTGKPFVLPQHRGRVVFLDFYASWCGPCKLALPLVERYARAHPEVDVVPVDVGEPRGIVAAFAREQRLRDVALDPQTLSQGFFQINGFPTLVVIDPQGRVRATWTGFSPAVELNMGRAESALQRRAS